MQRIEGAKAALLDDRPQPGLGLVALATAGLGPGQQHRQQRRRGAIARQGADPALGTVPTAGQCLAAQLQQDGHGVVGQPPGQAQRLGAAVEHAGPEGPDQQFGIIGVATKGGEELVGGGGGINLGGSEAAGQEGADGARRRLGGARRAGGSTISRRSTSRAEAKQRSRQKGDSHRGWRADHCCSI